jgi:hypothetical protein
VTASANESASANWILGLGALVFGGVAVAAAVAGRREAGTANALGIVPRWMASYLRYTPDAYADLIAKLTRPEVEDPWCTDEWHMVKYLYNSLEEARARIGRYDVRDGFTAGRREFWQERFARLLDAMRRADRSALSAEERRALKSFLAALDAYKRVSLAFSDDVVAENERIRAQDMAAALAIGVESVVDPIRGFLEAERQSLQRELQQGQYPKKVISNERIRLLEKEIEEISQALRELELRGTFPAKHAPLAGRR